MTTFPDVKAVLIIDDDELFLTLLKTFCNKLFPGAVIDQFNPVSSGKPPQDFDWDRYDLLFLDYDLGKGENGLEWLRRYKNTAAFPATIMLTAMGNEELAVQAMHSGAEDYINKEKVSMARLEHAVRDAFARHRSQVLLTTSQTLQTTLYNKIHFYKKLKDAVSNHAEGKHSFLLQIQINEFKNVHDAFGLLAADNFISRVALGIGTLVNKGNARVNLTRIGDALIGCLVTEQTDDKGGEEIAKSICASLPEQPIAVDSRQITPTVSIGIVPFIGTESVDTILDRADQACRKAAHESGSNWAWYSADGLATDAERAAGAEQRGKENAGPAEENQGPGADYASVYAAPMPVAPAPAATAQEVKTAKHVIDVTEAIKQNLIQGSFRPFVALSDSASQFEADLFQLRMNVISVDGDSVAQEDLPASAFKTGNPGMLDLWAVRFALSQLLGLQKIQDLRKRGLFLRLFEESLADNKLYDWIKNLMAKIKAPHIASTIVFEISPPAFLKYKTNAMNFIAQMRDTWGMGFALYDVVNPGVYDTCQKQAGFEFLEVSVAQKDQGLIATLAESAREAGALTILENISDAQQLNMAIKYKFDYGQGDFIQSPQDKLDIASEVIQI